MNINHEETKGLPDVAHKPEGLVPAGSEKQGCPSKVKLGVTLTSPFENSAIVCLPAVTEAGE